MKEGYLCSAAMVGAYRNSKVEDISKSASAIHESYNAFGNKVDILISDIKAEMDGGARLPAGTRAERDADEQLDSKRKWEAVIAGIGLASSAARDESRIDPKSKTLPYLLITRAERDHAIKLLKSAFKLPDKANRAYLDFTAQFFYDFLHQPWKFK